MPGAIFTLRRNKDSSISIIEVTLEFDYEHYQRSYCTIAADCEKFAQHLLRSRAVDAENRRLQTKFPFCHKELGDENAVDLCMTPFQLRNSVRFEINNFSEEDLFTHRVIQKKKCLHTVGFVYM